MAYKGQSPLVPETIGVKYVNPNDLTPNPHNPRILFDKAPLATLQESIKKVGILVPLTVYRESKTGRYVILDGQRRWTCAIALKMDRVPVNQVAEPTLVQNIVTMFQIHKLREDWELMPTALKLEVLMKKLNEKSEKKLAELTGLDQAVVVRCKKLLSYPKGYQDMMLDPDPEKRMKADFFIELYPVRNDRVVNKFSWFSKDKFTHRMLDKYHSRSSGFKSVTDFRIMKQHINNAHRAKKDRQISEKLREFLKDDSLTLDHLIIKSASVSAQAHKLLQGIKKLEEEIKHLDVNEYYGEEEMWIHLERLMKLIETKLRASGRRIKR